ncbi:hypothetical protein DOTSEDRAFT_39471 [Dothistroma septosporum NZE10]|uniref:Uncharacterized protein n=1 Tax=Dothistroma septosporum (strain NZE10 / CBS 128990) TaxID=675120 RepID=N1PDF4_DOTSN|nr:hypothetical protein DOTSEDRAFT_39471 [Dothistroma septosporum NZE10]
MGEADESPVYGIFRFLEPDLSVPAEDRAIFAAPANVRAVEERIQLHDFRTSADVARGAQGLDVQAFTYIKHKSSLSGEEMLQGTNVEDIYAPETVDMILKLTGASRGVVHNVAFRRDPATKQNDLKYVMRAGGERDQAVMSLPQDRVLVNGRNNDSTNEPARHAHCDMILESLRDTLTMCRHDICEAAKPAAEAEAMRAQGAVVQIPRYAAYSVWRPLKTVKRDPIAVLDYRSIDSSELPITDFRVPSAVLPNGEYIVKAWLHGPPKHPENLKWYWIPEQTPEDVAIIKFSDSVSVEDPSVAAGCIHCSPIIEGTEGQETRQSVECRVYAFWD